MLRERIEGMKSLESRIRELMITVGDEAVKLVKEIDRNNDPDIDERVRRRLSYLEELHSHCLITIDREIRFFGNN